MTPAIQSAYAGLAILGNWIAQLDDDRIERGFAWHEYADATRAFTTNAPTAPYGSLPNLCIAATRQTTLDPGFPAAQLMGHRVSIEQTIVHTTRDAATSVGGANWSGEIRERFAADFLVVDTKVHRVPVARLLTARAVLTVSGGRVTFRWRDLAAWI